MPEPPTLQFSDKKFQVWSTEAKLPNGQLVTKSIIRHPGAVVILPIVSANEICLIKNYRVAVGKVLLELPAGTREPNEPAIETARRELTEETGYRTDQLAPLTAFFAAPGIMDERLEVFVATDLKLGEHDRQPDEDIENRIMTFDEVKDAIHGGQIEDAKTIAALLFFFSFPPPARES